MSKRPNVADDLIDRAVDVLLLGHVTHERERLAAERLEPLNDGGDVLSRAVQDGDVGTHCGEGGSEPAADCACAAGYERDAAIEPITGEFVGLFVHRSQNNR